MPGLSPKLPLHIDQIDGYALTKNFKEVARQNLKMVVLTSPGERIMLPNFGVGIKRYLFENADTFVFSDIEERIRQQVRTHLPYIRIDNINFLSENNDFVQTEIEPSSLSNYLHIHIRYRIPSIFISDTLSLQI